MNTSSKLGASTSASSSTFTLQQTDLPDLSHLSENERKIIEAVLERQKLEDEKNLSIIVKNKQKSFDSGSSYDVGEENSVKQQQQQQNKSQFQSKQQQQQHNASITQSITDIAQEAKQKYGYNTIDTGDICDICKKTKFVNCNAHICIYCKLKCCIRCAFRLKTKTKQLWACNQCKLKQDAILKSNQWLNNNSLAKCYASDYLINNKSSIINKKYSSLVDNSDNNNNSNGDNSNNMINDSSVSNVNISRGYVLKPKRSFDYNDNVNSYNSNATNSQLKRNLTISGDNYNDYNETMQQNEEFNNKIDSDNLNNQNVDNTKSKINSDIVPLIDDKIKQLSSSSSSSSVFLRNQLQKQQQQAYLSKQNSLDIDDNSNNMLNENEYINSSSPSKQIKRTERLVDPLNILKKTMNRSGLSTESPPLTSSESTRRLLPKPIVTNSKITELPSTAHLITTIAASALANTTTTTSSSNDKVLQKQYSSSSSSSLTQTSADSKPQNLTSKIEDQIETISELDHEKDIFKYKQNYNQRKHQLLHTDSLSSDPSDCMSKRNSICLPNSTSNNANSNVNTQRQSTTPTSVSVLNTKSSTLPLTGQQPSTVISRMKRAKIKANKQHSLSSSDEYDEYEEFDEEIRSTTEYTTNDEMDLESGSISDKGAYLRKLDKNLEKEEILAAKMKKFLSPLTWKMSEDRKRLVGHIVFKKDLDNPESPQSIGIKVVGGQILPNGSVGAIIEKIKKGSPGDTIYHLKQGDEIVEWNHIKLRNLTHDEVFNIMSKSRFDSQIEIIVERFLEVGSLNNVNNEAQTNLVAPPISNINNLNPSDFRIKTDEPKSRFGQCEIKFYHDNVDNRLFIKLINLAINLLFKFDNKDNEKSSSRTSNNNIDIKTKLKTLTQIENVYFEMYLFTKIDNTSVLKSSDIIKVDLKNITRYNLTQEKIIVFDNIFSNDTKNICLVIKLIEYSNKFTLGECKIDLSKVNLNNESQFYTLIHNDEYLNDLKPTLSSLITTSPNVSSAILATNNTNNTRNNNIVSKITFQSNKIPAMTLLADKFDQNPNESSNENLSVSSNRNTNSSNNTIKRRQLPQIPLDRQQMHRDKIALDLEGKALKIKHEYETNVNKKQNYSISDSESNIDKYTLNMKNNQAKLKAQTSYEDDNEEQYYDSNVIVNRNNHNVETKRTQRKMPVITTSMTTPPITKIAISSLASSINPLTTTTTTTTATTMPFVTATRLIAHNKREPLIQQLGKQEYFVDDEKIFEKSSQRNDSKTNVGSLDLQKHENNNNLDTQTEFYNDATKNYGQDNSLYQKSQEYDIQQTQRQSRNHHSRQQLQQQEKHSEKTVDAAFRPIMPARKLSPTPSPLQIRSRSHGGNNGPEKFSIMKDLKQRSIALSNNNINKIDNNSFGKQLIKQYTTGHINNLNDTNNRKVISTTHTYDFDSDGSEFSTMSKLSATSALSTQSEKPKGVKSRFQMNTSTIPSSGVTSVASIPASTLLNNTKSAGYGQIHSNNANTITTANTTTLSNTTTQITPIPTIKTGSNKLTAMLENDRKDGALSDSALTNPIVASTENKKRRPSMAKALVILGLSKKSNSACNLSYNKRFGFARSEEIGVVPELRNDSSKEAQTPDSAGEKVKKPNLWSGALKLPHEKPFNEFVDGLGPGQKVGRQVLGSPCLGEIQMSTWVEKGQLVVEIIRAKNLKLKSGYRVLPAAYVKLYLFDGRSCIEKQKTSIARRTLDPMYQEVLRFQQNFKDKFLQVTVWGDYGKLDRKVFMGIAQISLNELDLTNMVIGWYKLYSVSSLLTDYHTMTSLSQNNSLTNLSSTESGYSFDSGSVKTTK